MEPASGVPSFTLYRGSLLALLIGIVLAVWLLVQPPGTPTDAAFRPVVLTPTPETNTTAAANTTPAPEVTQPATNTTPQAGATATAGTPRPTGTVGTTATPASGANTYTVKSGDTLSTICSSQRPSLPNTDCVTQLRSLNSITGDDISIDQVLRLP
jgi:LysM repeat protein